MSDLEVKPVRMCDAFPLGSAAREMADEFGRVPFHLNPNAYTRAENHVAHALSLAGISGDAWLYVGKVAS